MLSKKNRLTKKEDFKKVQQKGNRVLLRSEGVSISFIENNLADSRVGFSIGKSFSLKATERNRAKRILSEIIAEYLDKIRPKSDVIIFCGGQGRKKILEQGEETREQLEEALRKNNLLKK